MRKSVSATKSLVCIPADNSFMALFTTEKKHYVLFMQSNLLSRKSQLKSRAKRIDMRQEIIIPPAKT